MQSRSRRGSVQTRVHLPEQFLRHRRVARPVRVREGVAPGGKKPPHLEELPAVDRHGVADLVEAEGPGELPEHQRVDLVGLREDPRLDAAGLDELFDQAHLGCLQKREHPGCVQSFLLP